jgi:hypothetical protein
VVFLDDCVGAARPLAVEDHGEDQAERAGAHQDVADHGQVDTADPVRDRKGQDAADRQQEDPCTADAALGYRSLETD